MRQLIWHHLDFDPADSPGYAGFGAITLSGFPVEHYIHYRQTALVDPFLPPIEGTEEPWIINRQFQDGGEAPAPSVLGALAAMNDTLWQKLSELGEKQADQLGIQCRFVDYSLLPEVLRDSVYSRLFIGEGLPERAFQITADSIYTQAGLAETFATWQKNGLVGWRVPRAWLERYEPKKIKRLLKDRIGFSGLILVEVEKPGDLFPALEAGADMFWTKADPELIYSGLKNIYKDGALPSSNLEAMCGRLLLVKEWLARKAPRLQSMQTAETPAPQLASMTYDNAPENPEAEEDSVAVYTPAIKTNLIDDRWRWVNWKANERSLTLVNNREGLLPFSDLYRRQFRVIQVSESPAQQFFIAFNHYADAAASWLKSGSGDPLPILPKAGQPGQTFVIALAEKIDPVRDSVFVQQLKELNRTSDLVLVYFGDPGGAAPVDTAFTLVYAPEFSPESATLAAQGLFGGVSFTGRLPSDINAWFSAGCGEGLPEYRLKFGLPEEVGMAPHKLIGIDAIAQTAISDGAMPGSQITVVKDGIVVYSKAFGQLEYDKKSPETTMDDLFDVASITKVAATSLMAMEAYDNDLIELNDRLSLHLDLPKGSQLKNLTLKKLMTHQTGLQPNMPVTPILLYRGAGNAACDSFFCTRKSDMYNVQVADSFYFSSKFWDQVWDKTNDLTPRKRKKYLYSDVNMILLQQVLERRFGQSLSAWLDQHVYRELGLRHTLFNPLRRFPKEQIAPTEKDDKWRRQVLQGYVHDETAALMGGVGGHAGLFSTAEDLAVIGQMLLNGGHYAGIHFIDPETIKAFTTPKYGNQRGLCFDTAEPESKSARAESASEHTYGHTGFTGGCIWIDPDQNLVFVFLSNRIYPDRNNRKLFQNKVRERIHEIVYDALDTFHPGIPELADDLSAGKLQ